MSKYGNKKTVIDGIKFDSKAEARRYGELKILERVGEITDLRLQPKYELQPKFKRGKKTILPITYIADFEYLEVKGGKVVAEDVKGGTATQTPVFRVKAKMFQFKYPDIELRIVS